MSATTAAMPTPNITLYFLQASRSIRVAWLLEELSLPYTCVFFPREKNKAPADFKSRSGNELGKAPVLWDGELMVVESGAITEYLLETYDRDGKLSGAGDVRKRNKIRGFVHAAEGTFMTHCLAVLYARWACPASMKLPPNSNNSNSGGGDGDESSIQSDLEILEEGLSVNIAKDLDWLEGELKAAGGGYLVGGDVTAADTMVLFGVQFIFERGLCRGGGGRSGNACRSGLRGVRGGRRIRGLWRRRDINCDGSERE